jgi:hypothetical protein
MEFKMINNEYYEVFLKENELEIKIHYSPKAEFKKQKLESPLRDFLLENSKIKKFKSDYEFQDHLNFILKDKILTSEEKLVKLLKILEGN